MKGYKLAKVDEDTEWALDHISELTGASKSAVLGMCLSIISTYPDNQILAEAQFHLPKDKRRKENR
jgi:hypothetical protein